MVTKRGKKLASILSGVVKARDIMEAMAENEVQLDDKDFKRLESLSWQVMGLDRAIHELMEKQGDDFVSLLDSEIGFK